MTPELWALAAVVLIQVFGVFWAQSGLTTDVGSKANAGPRDDDLALSPRTRRLRRAVDNHVENFPMFIAAVVVVVLSGGGNLTTAICAWIFVAARALYFPAYAFGWVPWRSVIFGVGLVATLVMLVAGLVA